MRKIDIFLSCPQDVEKERIIAERLIRSIAAEYNIAIEFSYSNWMRGGDENGPLTSRRRAISRDHEPILRASFWEYPNELLAKEFKEHIPNTGQFDLVICILGSQLGPRLAPLFVMPDGSEPKCSTHYEIGWVLDQARRTPGFPTLRVYRNRSILVPSFKSTELENLFAQRLELIKEFFTAGEAQAGEEFRKACQNYYNLGEFERLFREHFHEFLAKQLSHGIAPKFESGCSWKTNPFRGLEFFDFEHAPVFCGRTKAVEEIINSFEKQAGERTRFVLVSGPSGSGKTSLLRAGVLPLLTQLWNGPWRRAVARPGAEDPFEALAIALLEPFALPELENDTLKGRQNLTRALREDPESVALRVKQSLEQISLLERDQLIAEQERRLSLSENGFGAEIAHHRKSRRVQPKARLVLAVDQLEELFRLPEEVQQAYVGALKVLAGSHDLFVIAAFRGDTEKPDERLAEWVKLAGRHGNYELSGPSRTEIVEMVQLPAKLAGLRFGRDSESGRGLDDYLVDAALESSDPVPVLEHLLSQLYAKQLTRSGAELSLVDYRALIKAGGKGRVPDPEYRSFTDLDRGLANHAEGQLAPRRQSERRVLRAVIRQLVVPAPNGEPILREVPYRELIASSNGDKSFYLTAQNLVGRLVEAGLLRAHPDQNNNLNIALVHEIVLRKWPRVWKYFCQERDSAAMRARLDLRLSRWENGNRKKSDLLVEPGDLTEAQILMKEFRVCLSKAQIVYLNRSLGKIAGRKRGEIAVAALALLAILLVAGGSLYGMRINGSEQKKAQLAQMKADSAIAQSNTLDTELIEALAKLDIAQANVLRAEDQRSGLEALLKSEQERARQAEANADEAIAQSGVLANELEEMQGKARAARAVADEAIAQSSALQTELKETQGKVEEAQVHAEEAEIQRGALETLLKSEQEKTREIQTNVEAASARRIVLEAELKEAQEKFQAAQVSAEHAVRERKTLELKKDESEPARGVQALMEIARVDSGNAPARPSVPAGNAKVAAPPAQSAPRDQMEQPASLVWDEESVKAFVLDYLRTIANNDLSTQERFFSDRVNFYSRGVLPLAKVQDATKGYHEEWPFREWNPRGPATVSRESALFVVLQPFTWSVSDGSQSSHGDAMLYLRIRKNPQGEFRIVKVEQREE